MSGFLRGQPLAVFYSATPPTQRNKYTMWLRNSLPVHYPDNMYLVHLLDTKEVPGTFPQFIDDFVDTRLSWTPIQLGSGSGKYSTPTIGVYKQDGVRLDDALHIMHIMVGSFVVHLVGRRSQDDFDRLTQTLLEEDMGVPVHVGFINIPAQGNL